MQQYRKHPWITIHTVTEQNRKQHEIPFILPWNSTENIHGLPFILSQNRLKNTAWITIHTTVEQYRKHPWITIHTVTEQTKKNIKKMDYHSHGHGTQQEICMDYHLVKSREQKTQHVFTSLKHQKHPVQTQCTVPFTLSHMSGDVFAS